MQHFKCVFPCDLIPCQWKAGEQLIVSTDPHYQPGSHYIVLQKQQHHVLYFDPLALHLPTSFPELHRQMKNKRMRWKSVLKTPIQSAESKFCGFYCVDYILKLEKQCPAVQRYKKTNLLLNDYICISNILRRIRDCNK